MSWICESLKRNLAATADLGFVRVSFVEDEEKPQPKFEVEPTSRCDTV